MDEKLIKRQQYSATVSKTAQMLFDAILTTSTGNYFGKIKYKLLMVCRRWMTRAFDPLVSYRLDGSKLLLPLSHNLPVHRKRFPHYSSNVARIAKYVVLKYQALTFIDIGANIGDTVAILRGQAHFPILCIEGCNNFFRILQMNSKDFDDIFLEQAFVNSQSGSVMGSFNSQGGTAHFVENEFSGETTHIQTLSDILKTQPLFAKSKMIKIDTDGLDCRILSSELAFLSQVRPVIFFEYDPYWFDQYDDNGFGVFASLQKIGYVGGLVYENNGDYLLSVELENRQLLQDIHEFYSGRSGGRYCDICLFHYEDSDLLESIRLAEIEFFARLRGMHTDESGC